MSGFDPADVEQARRMDQQLRATLQSVPSVRTWTSRSTTRPWTPRAGGADPTRSVTVPNRQVGVGQPAGVDQGGQTEPVPASPRRTGPRSPSRGWTRGLNLRVRGCRAARCTRCPPASRRSVAGDGHRAHPPQLRPAGLGLGIRPLRHGPRCAGQRRKAPAHRRSRLVEAPARRVTAHLQGGQPRPGGHHGRSRQRSTLWVSGVVRDDSGRRWSWRRATPWRRTWT
ncbi:hypothetical protein QJS66_22660 [Kocuria rhizophila]|nr:hypothetical protein QJS66_22660 [Kocuria rhizophila]